MLRLLGDLIYGDRLGRRRDRVADIGDRGKKIPEKYRR